MKQKDTFLHKQKKKNERIYHIPSFSAISQKVIFFGSQPLPSGSPENSYKRHRYNAIFSMKSVKIAIDTLPSGMETDDFHTRRLRPMEAAAPGRIVQRNLSPTPS